MLAADGRILVARCARILSERPLQKLALDRPKILRSSTLVTSPLGPSRLPPIKDAFRKAVQNVAEHGDTDVFPFPVENHVFHDKQDEVVQALVAMHRDLDAAIAQSPPVVEGMLAAVGYAGFRWATQIDPIWNAYLLGLVITVAPGIEEARLPLARGTVFSYRYRWDKATKSLFRRDVGWVQFQQVSVEKARTAKYVLSCDIADFYPRIYHHRLENALHRATSGADACGRIMRLLMQFAGNVSYGLPVGGPAARLLSELLLNSVDRLLVTHGVEFCRFADDYHVFANSQEEAYRQLVLLSEKLMINEGLLLQKTKTRVMTTEEFLSTSEFAPENQAESEDERQSREFLRLRLYYDPYSPTAEADYDALKADVDRYDVLSMLGRELRKSRVQQSLARKLISALRLVDAPQRDAAVLSLLDNLHTLYPVYPSIMLLVRGIIGDMAGSARDSLLGKLRQLVASGAYAVQVPTHLAHTVRVLAYDNSPEADEVLASIYRDTSSAAIRRDVILAMAKRRATFWVSDMRRRFATVTPWERTALIVGSYSLGDEGAHWRKSLKGQLTPMQQLVVDWMASRTGGGNQEVPL